MVRVCAAPQQARLRIQGLAFSVECLVFVGWLRYTCGAGLRCSAAGAVYDLGFKVQRVACLSVTVLKAQGAPQRVRFRVECLVVSICGLV